MSRGIGFPGPMVSRLVDVQVVYVRLCTVCLCLSVSVCRLRNGREIRRFLSNVFVLGYSAAADKNFTVNLV